MGLCLLIIAVVAVIRPFIGSAQSVTIFHKHKLTSPFSSFERDFHKRYLTSPFSSFQRDYTFYYNNHVEDKIQRWSQKGKQMS
jgi:hypothetical protein